jgi:NAD(P)H-dependent FMN reductase
MNLLVLLGSLRADSHNARLADAAIAHLPSGVEVTVFDALADLPHYSADIDAEPLPAVAARLRAEIAAADAVLVVTPEYNGSLPGSLKNAIDWASRPRGSAALSGIPTAVLAASISPRAAQWAREDAVRVLRVAGAAVIEDTVGVGTVAEAFSERRLVDADLDAALRDLMLRLTSGARQRRAA